MRMLGIALALALASTSGVALAQSGGGGGGAGGGSSGSGAGTSSSTTGSATTDGMGGNRDAQPQRRQPRPSDFPSGYLDDISKRSPEDEALDRKLNICRSC